jgi:uncharacterized protein YlxP (DUF503 family)
VPSYVALLRIHLHFPDAGSLKGKRKELSSVKAQLHQRLGVTVCEADHHDLWQRSELAAALTAPSMTALEQGVDRVCRFLEERFPEGVRVERTLVSFAEVEGLA